MIREEDGTVVCDACGVVDVGATALFARLNGDCHNLEADLRAKRARIREITGENGANQEADPLYATAIRVLGFWKNILAPHTRELEAAGRVGPVIARLRGGYDEDSLNKCTMGYALFPYVVDGKRQPHGTKAQRHVKATLIFRDADHVDQGLDLLTRSGQRHADIPIATLAKVPWRKVMRANRILIRRYLDRRGGGFADDPDHIFYPCPQGREDGHLLRFWITGTRLVTCHVCDMTDEKMLELAIADER